VPSVVGRLLDEVHDHPAKVQWFCQAEQDVRWWEIPFSTEAGNDDRADPEQVRRRGRRRSDGVADPLVGRLELGVEATDVVEELDGQVVADLLDRVWRSRPSSL